MRSRVLKIGIGVVLGAIVVFGGIFAVLALRMTTRGYGVDDMAAALGTGVYEAVLTHPYSQTVDAALSSEEFRAENLERYFEVDYVSRADLTEVINRLTEVGYGAREVSLASQKLGAEAVDWVVERGYWPELGEVLGLDYFWEENLARYAAELEAEDGGAEEIVDASTSAAERADAAVVRVNIGLDLEPYTDATEVEGFDELMIVNKYHHLGEEYEPERLTEVRKDCVKGDEAAELAGVAAEAFTEMCLAARAEGLGLVANSAYRGYKEQAEVLAEQTRDFGEAYATAYVSRPGFSEHQTGLALDVAAADAEVFKGTPEYEWMLENAPKYGFILRYLEGKEEVTGYEAEAWHLRYVGTEVAAEITEKDETLEEYIAKLPK